MEVLTVKTKEEINAEILASRTSQFNQLQGVRLGDFIKLPTEKGDFFTRVTHVYDDHVQTGGSAGNAYYLGNGYLSYSGGLDTGLKICELLPTNETKLGAVWFFSENHSKAHNGVDFEIEFRVFTVRTGADIKGLYDYHKKLESIELAKLPTITRINGNGQPYTTPLPKITLCKAYNDVFMKRIEENTGLKFLPGPWGQLTAQPTTHEQINIFMLCHNWNYKYYNNSTFENVIMIDREERKE